MIIYCFNGSGRVGGLCNFPERMCIPYWYVVPVFIVLIVFSFVIASVLYNRKKREPFYEAININEEEDSV